MNNFLKVQLNRACYVSLLNISDTEKGFLEYKKYIKKLNFIALNPFNLLKVMKEKKQAKSIFVEKMKKIVKTHFDNKEYAKAQELYQIIFETDSKDIENIKNYINCLEKLEQYDVQLELAKHLINIKKTPDNYKILSTAFGKVLKYKEAIEYYIKYFKLSNKPKMDAADNNAMGCYYYGKYLKCGEHPEDAKNAINYMKKAIEEAPSSKAYLKNGILAASRAKEIETEMQYWEKFVKEGWATKDDEFSYSATAMRAGDIKTWAKYYGARFEKKQPAPYPDLGKPLYTGKEDLSNKTLMIHSEQGYGDNFLMWGYMPRMKKLAKKIIYYIQNNAYELVKDNDFGIEVYCKNIIDEKKLDFDYQLPCMSIPIVLGLDKNTISVNGGYIKPIKLLREKYNNEFFNNNKLKIAIGFRGVAGNQKRDIPLKHLKLLDNLKNVQLYCFTKDVNDEELKCFKKNKVINIAKEFENFAHTAAALDCCDLVIASDNCILNLAGAIGKKTFGIFNYHYEFRWYDLKGENCGWFTSVKPFINNEYNDWGKTILKVIEEIKSLQQNG